MENIIRKYSDIVIDYHIPSARERYNKLIQEARITFVDTSKFVVHDILFFLDKDSIRRKYSFQWMNADNTLIIRWDNAPNHKEVAKPVRSFYYHNKDLTGFCGDFFTFKYMVNTISAKL